MSSQPLRDTELRELYRELILDHARQPRHYGKLDHCTHSAKGLNPLCGDSLHLCLVVGDDGRLADARFEGAGCAISVASASLLTDTVIGMQVEQAQTFADSVTETLTGQRQAAEPDLGKLRALEGVRAYPTRVKCATLAWHAMKSALANKSETATTE